MFLPIAITTLLASTTSATADATLLSSTTSATINTPPTRVLDFPLKHAAVATFDTTTYPNVHDNGPALLLTSFFPFGNDGVYSVPNIRQHLANPFQAVNITTLDANANWPNMASPVPTGAVPSWSPSSSSSTDPAYVLTAGGFFVSPSKATGDISLLDITNVDISGAVTKTTISTPKKGNFYHQAEWVDIDGDSKLDILAARAYKPSFNPFGKSQGNLVWLKPPNTPGGPWIEQQLTGLDGPGVAFTLCDVDGDGKEEVVAAQYFVKAQLSMWWCEADHWSGCINGTNVKSLVIDAAEGAPFFAVEWTDLNGDGKKELLATTNTANGKGAVFVYEQNTNIDSTKKVSPKDISWTKHKIADGYKPTKAYLPGRGSPGRATSFFVHKNDTMKSILVSADDGGWMDLLIPSSTASTAWTYDKIRVLNSTGTVGTPGISDVDGDGWAEFAVPLFAEDKVALYTFKK